MISIAAGEKAGANDVRDGPARVLDPVEDPEQGTDGFGHREQRHFDLGGDPEAALGADEEPDQVVARGFPCTAPQLDQRSVGQHDLQARHVPGGDSVLQAVRPARVLRDVAADRARGLGRRVRGVVEALTCRRGGELRVDDARLEDRAPVGRVDLEDAVHPRGPDHHGAVQWHGPPGKPRPRPARHDREAEAGHLRDASPELLGGARKDDRAGPVPVCGEGVGLRRRGAGPGRR